MNYDCESHRSRNDTYRCLPPRLLFPGLGHGTLAILTFHSGLNFWLVDIDVERYC